MCKCHIQSWPAPIVGKIYCHRYMCSSCVIERGRQNKQMSFSVPLRCESMLLCTMYMVKALRLQSLCILFPHSGRRTLSGESDSSFGMPHNWVITCFFEMPMVVRTATSLQPDSSIIVLCQHSMNLWSPWYISSLEIVSLLPLLLFHIFLAFNIVTLAYFTCNWVFHFLTGRKQ